MTNLSSQPGVPLDQSSEQPHSRTLTWDELPLIAPHPLLNRAQTKRIAQPLALQLLREMTGTSHRRIAVVAPDSDANGAFATVLSGLCSVHDRSVLAMDMNLRRPWLESCLSLAPTAQGSMLEVPLSNLAQRIARIGPKLALVTQSDQNLDPVAHLTAPDTAQSLDRLEAELTPDLTLVSLPGLLNHPDLLAFAPQLDAVVLCLPYGRTRQDQLDRTKEVLAGVLPILGTILTDQPQP